MTADTGNILLIFSILKGVGGGSICSATNVHRVTKLGYYVEVYPGITPIVFNPNPHAADTDNILLIFSILKGGKRPVVASPVGHVQMFHHRQFGQFSA